MHIHPLNRKIFERAKKLGLRKIMLGFQGGSDEGYLNVDVEFDLPEDAHQWEHMRTLPKDEQNAVRQFTADVEEWAWTVYHYSGAGDGSGDYGDDIAYNILDMTATHSDWWQETTYGDTTDGQSFKLADGDEEDVA